MTGERLIEKVMKTLQDPSIDEDEILELLIEGHMAVARQTFLPDLIGYATVDTVPGQIYYGLPADFSHELFACTDQEPSTNPIRVVNSLGVMFAKYGALNNTGLVRHVCIAAGSLAIQPVPAEVRTLTLHYYRNPVDLTADTEPEGLLPHLHKMLEHYACWRLFCDIEDGIEGKAVNTEKHLSLFKADLNSLIILTKQGRTRVAPPVVKGEFL